MFQRVLEHGEKSEVEQVVVAVAKKPEAFRRAAMVKHGTRSVQVLLSACSPDQMTVLADVLRGSFVQLAASSQGHHVATKFLKIAPSECVRIAIDEIQPYCVSLSQTRYGCVVVRCCLDYADEDHHAKIAGSLMASASTLARDCFANYVLQHLIDGDRDGSATASVTRFVLSEAQSLIFSSTASHVVEKVIRAAAADEIRAIVAKILAIDASKLLSDRYATYVPRGGVSATLPTTPPAPPMHPPVAM